MTGTQYRLVLVAKEFLDLKTSKQHCFTTLLRLLQIALEPTALARNLLLVNCGCS